MWKIISAYVRSIIRLRPGLADTVANNDDSNDDDDDDTHDDDAGNAKQSTVSLLSQ